MIFRNPSGITHQILSFHRSYQAGRKDVNVGAKFYEVAVEFENRHDELHAVAAAIRRNVASFEETIYGSETEADGFPEGALLGHLHRVVEKRDGARLSPNEHCEICQINTDENYPGCSGLMTMHLAVPVIALDGQKKYGEDAFITVCPNCHVALHRRRPWLTKENCGDLLR